MVIIMIKILFVCHGNICRSPMAEYIMRDIVNKNNKGNLFEIASKGTSREELGNSVYPPVRRMLKEYGITCDGKTAVQMTKEDYRSFDYIVAMERRNISNIIRIVGDDADQKISLLLDYTDRPGDVADPWYTGDFEKTWDDILKGCQGLFNKLNNYTY